MRFKLLLFVCIYSSFLFSQADSVMYSNDPEDGVYLTYADFRRNNFIGKTQIVTDINKDQLEFIGKVMDSGKLSYKTEGGVVTIDPRLAWGFFQNKTLYINFKSEFYRVPVFGAICYLVATVTVINSGFYDPMFGYGVNGTRTKEIREFMINFYDGIMVEFTMEKAEQILSKDAVLFAEYKELSRKKQKDQIHRYMRRYNEAHPVYFLK